MINFLKSYNLPYLDSITHGSQGNLMHNQQLLSQNTWMNW
jgi:hypothetical protein